LLLFATNRDEEHTTRLALPPDMRGASHGNATSRMAELTLS
jgi:hypothetical protein